MPVIGMVETLNDSLNQPFARTVSGAIEGTLGTTFLVDIPPGKRLVIETITVGIAVPKGQIPYAIFYKKNEGDKRGILALNFQGYFPAPVPGSDQYSATHPVKLRFDGTVEEGELAFTIGRSSSAGLASATLSVHGYLVDL